MIAGFFKTVNQRSDFLPKYVVNYQLDLSVFWQVIFYRGGRIKGIWVVSMKTNIAIVDMILFFNIINFD